MTLRYIIRVDRGTTIDSDACPIGSIVQFAGGPAPSGWLETDGRELRRRDYIELLTLCPGLRRQYTSWWAWHIRRRFRLPDLSAS